jgi:hypothetical protein
MSSREISDAKNGITSRKEYGFRDPVVRLKMKGLTKYLNDVQEELMDAVLYIQAAREELQDLSEEALIDRHRDDNYYEAPMAYNLAEDYNDEEEN